MELILASNSPRRKELLKEFGFEFRIVPSAYCEEGEYDSPEQMVKAFALGKAKDVADKLDKTEYVVLGADTIVCLNGQVLGKPTDKNHARHMLKDLSGKTHQVYTGYAIIGKGQTIVDIDKTEVVFNNLSTEQINAYVDTGKPLDKAGAYGIQDGFNIVKEYHGSFNNVVGLPIEKFADMLKEFLK